MASPRRDPVGDNLSCLFAVRAGRDIRRGVRGVLPSAKRDLTSAGTPAQSDGAAATGEEAQLAEVVAALDARDCACLVQLTRAASSDAVRDAGCCALAEVAKSYGGSPELLAGLADTTRDVIEVLMLVLRAEAASEDVLAAGLKAVHAWCPMPQARVFAGEAGAFDAVVAAMRVNTASERLQAFGCGAFAALLFDTPANQQLAMEADAVAAVVTAMRTHADSAAVQLHGCDALSLALFADNCGSGAAAANRDAAVALGAIELVAAALVGADARASQAACLVLRDLIGLVPENVARAQRCGAFEATLEAMRLHTQHLNIQRIGCSVLGCMALESSGFTAADRLGAHAAIIHSMELFPADSHLQQNGCAALALLLPAAPTPNNDAKHAGAVACVVNALRAHVADADVQRLACKALVRLTRDQPLNNAKAFQLGAFAALAEVLKAHVAHADVVEPCMAALRSICLAARRQSAGSVLASEACVTIRAVVAAMRAFPKVLNIQSHAVAALGLFFCPGNESFVPNCAVAAEQASTIDAVVAALRNFVIDEDVSYYACMLFGSMSEHWSALREQGILRPAAAITDAFAATLTVLHTHPGNDRVLETAAYSLARLCDVAAGSQTGLQDAVAPLCAALRTHMDANGMQGWVLEALSKIVLDASAAVAAVSAGREGIGAVIELLMRSTPAQRSNILKYACMTLANVACCAEAKLSSAEAVGPLVHVLANCSDQNQRATVIACSTLLPVLQCSRQHAAEAFRLGAAAAVPRALLTDPEVAAFAAFLDAEASKRVQEALTLAQAREEAARRADAIAAELIAEEEEAARAAAAPPSRKSRKKRGGGASAAGGQRAEPASSETPPVPNAAPDSAAASAAALSELALSDAAAGAADTPSAAAARRRRRAATKAARKRAGASGGEAAARGGEPASGGEDDASEAEAEAEADAAAAPQPAEAEQPPDAAPAAPAAAPLPPPPASPVMKECCVCLSDMPAADLLVVVPCGHRCLCPDCWEQLEPPTARRCPICSAPAATAVRLERVFEL